MEQVIESSSSERSDVTRTLWERIRLSPPKTVLLVEDNEDDVLLIQRACDRSGISHALEVVADGEAAIDYLAGTGPYTARASHSPPDLVLLDINLPKRSGFEVLKWMRNRPELVNVPVVILTGSCERSDVEMACMLGVTCLLKTADSHEFARAVKIVLKYWLPSSRVP